MYYINLDLVGIAPIVGVVLKDEQPLFSSFLKTKENKGGLKDLLESSNKKLSIYKRLQHSRESIGDVKFSSGKLSFIASQKSNIRESDIVSYGDLAALPNIVFIQNMDNLREELKNSISNMLEAKSPLPIMDNIKGAIAEKIIENNLIDELTIISIDAFPYKKAFHVDINGSAVLELILREMVLSYGESQFIELYKRAPMIKSLLYMTNPENFSMKSWPKIVNHFGGKDEFEKLSESVQKSIVYCYEVFGEATIDIYEKVKNLSSINFFAFKELSIVYAKTKFKIDAQKILKIIDRLNDVGLISAVFSALEDSEFREFINQKGEISTNKLIAELTKRQYSGIKPGGEPMAIIAADVMMSQNTFEIHQDEYIKAMDKIPFMSRYYPTVKGRSSVDGYEYESMDMGNPRAWVLGIETHCCQHLGSVGGSCVKYAAANPDVSGMLRVTKNGKTKAQSWFWFHQESGTFVFDNIEVAGGSGIDELGESSAQKIIDTYMAFIENELVPRASLFGITNITVGLGYNELNLDMPTVNNPIVIGKMRNAASVYSDAGRQKLMKRI